MKKLKKSVCILLAMLLLCGIFAVQVSAKEGQDPDMDKLLETFKGYLDENNVEYKDWEELVTVNFIMESNGWNIFFGHPGFESPMPIAERIGKYTFFSMSYYVPYDLGLYVEKDGVVLTLKEAYEAGAIDLDQVVNSKKMNAYLTGDTNTDGVVNLQDVLMVHKVIAKMIDGSIGAFDPNAKLCDYNGDGEITLEDVLAMQNAIAKIA